MKNLKYFRVPFILFILMNTFFQCATAQQSNKNDAKKLAIKNMIDSQYFVFEAQTVSPLRGNFRNLTSSYDVCVNKDTLRSYLPFFGRAYIAPINQTKSPLDFTSTNFTYTVSPYKKSGWNIVIKPKDKTDVQQYSFIIFDNGNASLNVLSTSRDEISFHGYVKKKE